MDSFEKVKRLMASNLALLENKVGTNLLIANVENNTLEYNNISYYAMARNDCSSCYQNVYFCKKGLFKLSGNDNPKYCNRICSIILYKSLFLGKLYSGKFRECFYFRCFCQQYFIFQF